MTLSLEQQKRFLREARRHLKGLLRVTELMLIALESEDAHEDARVDSEPRPDVK